eukprot:1183900-Prorocentrum_minimum.AAC.7
MHSESRKWRPMRAHECDRRIGRFWQSFWAIVLFSTHRQTFNERKPTTNRSKSQWIDRETLLWWLLVFSRNMRPAEGRALLILLLSEVLLGASVSNIGPHLRDSSTPLISETSRDLLQGAHTQNLK